MDEPVAAIAEQLVREALLGSNHSGNSTVTLNVSDPTGTRARAQWAWVAAGLAVIAALFAMKDAGEARAELRAQRIEQAIMNKWTAQEVTAIRSYITTGRLAPMSPPPTSPHPEK